MHRAAPSTAPSRLQREPASLLPPSPLQFAYVPDEYAPGRTIDRTIKAAARARIPKPFVAMGRTGRGIAPVINYSGASGKGRGARAEAREEGGRDAD